MKLLEGGPERSIREQHLAIALGKRS